MMEVEFGMTMRASAKAGIRSRAKFSCREGKLLRRTVRPVTTLNLLRTLFRPGPYRCCGRSPVVLEWFPEVRSWFDSRFGWFPGGDVPGVLHSLLIPASYIVLYLCETLTIPGRVIKNWRGFRNNTR